MRGYPLLNSQDFLPDLAAAIFNNRRLPGGIRFFQLLDQAAGESKFGQRGLELIFALQLLGLLSGQISFEKNVTRILLLSWKNTDEKGKH
jgi:hypothetical protein